MKAVTRRLCPLILSVARRPGAICLEGSGASTECLARGPALGAPHPSRRTAAYDTARPPETTVTTGTTRYCPAPSCTTTTRSYEGQDKVAACWCQTLKIVGHGAWKLGGYAAHSWNSGMPGTAGSDPETSTSSFVLSCCSNQPLP